MYTGYPKTINEQIAEYDSSIKETFDIKDGNTLIVAADNVLDYMRFTYDGYKTQYPLYRLWSTYYILHHPDFVKAYRAWETNYKPLQNYDSEETFVHLISDGSNTETVTHGKVNTVSAGSGTNAPTTSNYITTDDSVTPRLETQSTQSGTTTDTESGSTTTSYTHTAATAAAIDGTSYTADKIESEKRTKSGNIGVTTSQQMLQAEIDLRLNPLVMQFIDMFMNEYTYYVSQEWCSYDS
ncbi:MAG: hypothetical protein J6Q19_00585 [Bacteroidaceae bacterium]|nr:hypothetical protein [Bacteroidaceae bacterium]